MNDRNGFIKRVVGVVVFFVVLTTVVFAIGEARRTPLDTSLSADAVMAKRLPSEANMYAAYAQAMTEAPRRAEASTRKLGEFYSRRAYNGAPPMVPHETGAEYLIADGCLSCHENGGYVPDMTAYAPVTPHPAYQNCRQCHLPMNEQTALFKGTNWERPAAPERQVRAMPGAPLVMPHGTQLRESCNACHAGPGAVKEVRVTHPWRTNCRQCHVPPTTQEAFSRPAKHQGEVDEE